MSDFDMVHHDIDSGDRLVERYYQVDDDPARRADIAEQLFQLLIGEQWLSELRCLRERAQAPCPNPHGHTHAPDSAWLLMT